MSDKRLTPDGQGGFHSLPSGDRLTPDGSGGFHILSGGGVGVLGGLGLLGILFWLAAPLILILMLVTIPAAITALATVFLSRVINHPGKNSAIVWATTACVVAIVLLAATGNSILIIVDVPLVALAAYKLWPK